MNELEKHPVTTREIAAIVPITVAEWYDAESGFWTIEGISLPLDPLWSSDLNAAENHVRKMVLAHWNQWCQMVTAASAPQHERVEDDGYERS